MNKINLRDGETHRILFSNGKLYLDGIQLAGEGINPPKDVMFEFKVNDEKQEVKPVDLSVLEIRVHDDVNSKDVGPGQG